MNDNQTSHGRIVDGIANIQIPSEILRQSDIRNIIPDIIKSQQEVKGTAVNLENLRQNQKNGNLISNWWNDRDDLVKDAQIDLNKTIGHLTEKTSTLLVVNTALAKQLNDQQNILIRQQKLLEQQTLDLKNQNKQIAEQQLVLESQQKDIILANQGLLEAKGITQDQAMQLVGCVKRVSEAEDKIKDANNQLRTDFSQALQQQAQHVVSQLEQHSARSAAFMKTANDTLNGKLLSMDQKAECQQHDLESSIRDRFSAIESAVSAQLAEQNHQLGQGLNRHRAESQALKELVSQKMQAYANAVQKKIMAQALSSEQQQEAFEKSHKVSHQNLANRSDQLEQAVKGLGQTLTLMQQESQARASQNRMFIGITACVSLVSIMWQVLQHLHVI